MHSSGPAFQAQTLVPRITLHGAHLSYPTDIIISISLDTSLNQGGDRFQYTMYLAPILAGYWLWLVPRLHGYRPYRTYVRRAVWPSHSDTGYARLRWM